MSAASALPQAERNIQDILRECKDLMRQKAAVHDKVKEYQFNLKKARYAIIHVIICVETLQRARQAEEGPSS